MGSANNTPASYPPSDSTLFAELMPYNRYLHTLLPKQPLPEILKDMAKTDPPTVVKAALMRALAAADLAEGLNAEYEAFRDKPALPGVEDNDLIAHFFGVTRDVCYLLADGDTAKAEEKLDLAYEMLGKERGARFHLS